MKGLEDKYLVANEAMGLMSVMRKSNKWVHSGISAILGTEDEPVVRKMGLRASAPSKGRSDLVGGLSRLVSASTPQYNNFSAPQLVAPFLKVIRSPQTSGSLTLRALLSVEKILGHVLTADSTDIAQALYDIALATTHCRFEAHDHAENDAVLHQIMAVMTTLVTGPLGALLPNKALCEIIETCLSMATHMRRGELLLRNARLTLTRLLVSAFSRMSLVPEAPEASSVETVPQLAGSLREAVEMESRSQTPFQQGTSGLAQNLAQNFDNRSEVSAPYGAASTATEQESNSAETSPDAPDTEGTSSPAADASNVPVVSEAPASDAPNSEAPAPEPEAPVSLAPYTSTALLQIYHVLVTLLEPSPKYTDKTRLMVLQLLCHIFETAGVALSNDPGFVEITSTQLFKSIAQIVRSTSAPLVAESLRLFNLIIETGGTKFILHLQFVLTYLLRCLSPLSDLPRDANIDSMFYDGVPSRPKCVKVPHSNLEDGPTLSSASNKSPEIREIMVEAIARMVHTDNFFTKLFTFYDCDTQQHNLCEDLIGFLCRNAYPDTATWSTASVPPLCLESILKLLDSFNESKDLVAHDAEIAELLKVKSRKAEEIMAAELFNEKPAKGIAYAIEKGVIRDSTPAAIAEFLHSSQRLNGADLGEYLAKNAEVYVAFLSNFKFANLRIDEALRELLAHFRLPGESGPIENLLDGLGEYYIGQPHDVHVIKSKDAAFVLSYAVIMLNTNLYNPQVKAKMSFKSFSAQVKGCNDKEDFPQDYLEGIYNTLAQHEMIFPAEHDNDESFERSWTDLQLALHTWTEPTVKPHVAINTEIFKLLWKPIVSTLAFIFATATDDLVFSRVISGIQRIATIAAAFGTTDTLDHILECLGRISILSSGDLAAPQRNIEVKITAESGAQHSVIVSDLSVAFGGDLKAQMASITLFKIIEEVKSARVSAGGWTVVARILTNLYLYDLVKPLKGVNRIKPCYTFEWGNSGKNVGIFSALSSYLTSAADTPSEPNDEDVDAALSAQDCIKICNVSRAINSIKERVDESAIAGIEAAIPEAGDEKHHAAILFLAHLLVQSVADKDELKPQVVRLLGKLPSSSAPAQFSGSVTSLLLQFDTLDGINLEPSGAPYFINSLLKHNDVKVWEFLSITTLDSLQQDQKDQLHKFVLDDSNHKKESLGAILKTLAKVVDSNPDALDTLYTLKENHVASAEDYYAFLEVAILPCASAQSSIREKALDKLQSEVQTYGILDRYSLEWQDLFGRGLIPLLELLLKPQVFKRDPKNMDATRQRSASIACKTFLVYAMHDDAHMQGVWLKVLNVLDRLLGSRKQPALHEGVAEMIKNVILVLKMSKKGDAEFWTATERALDWLPEVAALAGEQIEEEPSEASAAGVEASEAGTAEDSAKASTEPSADAEADGSVPDSSS